MLQLNTDGIVLQAGNDKLGSHCIYRLYGWRDPAARRTTQLLQGAMNQAAVKLPQPLGEARIISC